MARAATRLHWACQPSGLIRGMDFLAVYSVEVDVVAPGLIARRGDILAVHPAHPTANLVVCANRPGFPVLRTGFLPLGSLYGTALTWEADGVIRYLAGDLPARRSQSVPGIAG